MSLNIINYSKPQTMDTTAFEGAPRNSSVSILANQLIPEPAHSDANSKTISGMENYTKFMSWTRIRTSDIRLLLNLPRTNNEGRGAQILEDNLVFFENYIGDILTIIFMLRGIHKDVTKLLSVTELNTLTSHIYMLFGGPFGLQRDVNFMTGGATDGNHFLEHPNMKIVIHLLIQKHIHKGLEMLTRLYRVSVPQNGDGNTFVELNRLDLERLLPIEFQYNVKRHRKLVSIDYQTIRQPNNQERSRLYERELSKYLITETTENSFTTFVATVILEKVQPEALARLPKTFTSDAKKLYKSWTKLSKESKETIKNSTNTLIQQNHTEITSNSTSAVDLNNNDNHLSSEESRTIDINWRERSTPQSIDNNSSSSRDVLTSNQQPSWITQELNTDLSNGEVTDSEYYDEEPSGADSERESYTSEPEDTGSNGEEPEDINGHEVPDLEIRGVDLDQIHDGALFVLKLKKWASEIISNPTQAFGLIILEGFAAGKIARSFADDLLKGVKGLSEILAGRNFLQPITKLRKSVKDFTIIEDDYEELNDLLADHQEEAVNSTEKSINYLNTQGQLQRTVQSICEARRKMEEQKQVSNRFCESFEQNVIRAMLLQRLLMKIYICPKGLCTNYKYDDYFNMSRPVVGLDPKYEWNCAKCSEIHKAQECNYFIYSSPVAFIASLFLNEDIAEFVKNCCHPVNCNSSDSDSSATNAEVPDSSFV